MVISVDMQHLLSLDTQNTRKNTLSQSYSLSASIPQSPYAMPSSFPMPYCPSMRGHIDSPVPRTTTSYSGAISSISTVYRRICGVYGLARACLLRRSGSKVKSVRYGVRCFFEVKTWQLIGSAYYMQLLDGDRLDSVSGGLCNMRDEIE